MHINFVSKFNSILKFNSFKQFVAAGDHMVQQCPTWQWMKSEEGKKKEFFPDDKQFLITKNGKYYLIGLFQIT